ncbi:cytochrome c oxidase subunit IIa family protein [Melghiribacillus thermohalophilus]|uniref:Cytochrome c oxidase subunit IIa family protein n=1 Tax=Melghiribacillus thermohalophilus TaxID=1324956 RepID=A0A4R3MU94_9BACI|nr:cytochrome c oxidase subunit 2A [Melghiribacillus thermohalophilus]TCT20038.1 cytochrome c oxidase subunit IIa family protein [Melghiribacillus thermohalophilus]
MVTKDDLGRSSPDKDEDLKGTFVSVLIIGAIILVFWITLFSIFLSRM